MGKGIGIVPDENVIKSPIKGTVTALFPTKHAIGITSEDGVELLLHIGIDTVELEGKFFHSFVEQDDSVNLGDSLIKVDVEEVKKAGYDPTVIMIVTNTQDYLEVLPNMSEDQASQQESITVIL